MSRGIYVVIILFLLVFIPTQSLSQGDNQGNLRNIKSKIEPALFHHLQTKSSARIIITFEDWSSRKLVFKQQGIDRWLDLKIINGSAIMTSRDKIFELAKDSRVNYIYLSRKIWLTTPIAEKNVHVIKPNMQEYMQYEKVDKNWRQRLGIGVLEDMGIDGDNVVVAVIDSGIDDTHPDLEDAVVYEESFVDYDFDGAPDEGPEDLNGHGTHVAGIIAGRGIASGGSIKGVAPKAKLWNLRVFNEFGFGYDAWIIKAIDKAAQSTEVDIISMSLGGAGPIGSPVFQAAENAWKIYGKIVVCAAGNEYSLFSVGVPGSVHEIITVGAVDKDDIIANFSSRGPNYDLTPKPDILAPGVAIPSTYLGGSYAILSGTSMATPVVSGVVALLLQVDPSLTNDMVKYVIMSSAIDLGLSPYEQGAGLINPVGAYELLTGITVSGDYRQYDTLWDPVVASDLGCTWRGGLFFNQTSGTFVYLDSFVAVNISGYRHAFYFSELRPLSAYTYGSEIEGIMYGFYDLEDPLGSIRIRVFYYVDYDVGAIIEYNITPIRADSYCLYLRFDIDALDAINDVIKYTNSSFIIYDYILEEWFFVMNTTPQPDIISLESSPLFDVFVLASMEQILYNALKQDTYEIGNIGGVLGFEGTESKVVSIVLGSGETQNDAVNSTKILSELEDIDYKSYEISGITVSKQTGPTYSIDVEVRNFGTIDVSGLTLILYDNVTGEELDRIEGISLTKHESKTYSFNVVSPTIVRIELRENDLVSEDNTFTVSLLGHDFHGGVFHPFKFGAPLDIIYAGQNVTLPIHVILNTSISSPNVSISGNASSFVTLECTETLTDQQFILNLNISIPKTTSIGTYTLNISIKSGAEIKAYHEYYIRILGELKYGIEITDIDYEEGYEYSDDDLILEVGEQASFGIDINVNGYEYVDKTLTVLTPEQPYIVPNYTYSDIYGNTKTISLDTIILPTSLDTISYTLYIFAKDENSTLIIATKTSHVDIGTRDRSGIVDFQLSYTLYSYTREEYISTQDKIYSNDLLEMALSFENIGSSSAVEITYEVLISNITLWIGVISGIEPGESVTESFYILIPMLIGSGYTRFYIRVTYTDMDNMNEYSSLYSSDPYYVVGSKTGDPDINVTLAHVEEAYSPYFSDMDGKFEKGELGIFYLNVQSSSLVYYGLVSAIAKGIESMSGNYIMLLYLPTNATVALAMFGPEDNETFTIYVEVSYMYVENVSGELIPYTTTKQFELKYSYTKIEFSLSALIILLVLIIIIVIIIVIYYRRRKSLGYW